MKINLLFWGFWVLSQCLFAQSKNENPLQTLVQAELKFAQLANDQNTQAAFLANLAENAILFKPSPVNGKKWWQDNPGNNEGLLTWYPAYADISQAGDMGFTTGPWEFKKRNASEAGIAFGNFVSVWKKQTNGEWKVVVDFGNFNSAPQEKTPLFSAENFNKKIKPNKKANTQVEWQSLLALENKTSQTTDNQINTEALFLRVSEAPFKGKENLEKYNQTNFTKISYEVIGGEVAQSGDLAYSYGSFKARSNQTNNQEEIAGHYLRIWKKNAKNWELVLDIAIPNPKPQDN